ncbi:hypothetical protein B0A49_07052 [Cryomyces minteri]|uniref:Peptidyl-tRNA hydrolase n=1 Tax=Cryomyces minteri TaxID=331657 RepID=A0A4U0WZS1_9PEZI|nr:hypothetical protein B0A49_07052 [Cryomyces minteri]
MRFTTSLALVLPVLAAAEQQIPLVDKLQGWFDQAKSYIPTGASSPVDAGASKIAEYAVTRLSLDNWKSVLVPSASAASKGPEEWMVFITGGNKTCYGLCGTAEKAWNQSVAYLSSQPSAPHLAMVDCETQQVLCNSWAAGPPSVMHVLLPQPLPDQSKPATTVRYIGLNRTSTTAADITKIHTEKTYTKVAPYEGVWHPFNGPLQQFMVATPVGYVIWFFNVIPSWLFMVAISFFSRSFMGRRANAPQAPRQGGAAPAAPR